jgi:hypothetical protein
MCVGSFSCTYCCFDVERVGRGLTGVKSGAVRSWSLMPLDGIDRNPASGPKTHRKEGSQVLWEVIDGECYPSGHNPFGPVSMGWLRVRSHAAHVVAQERVVPNHGKLNIDYKAYWDAGDYSFEVRNGVPYEIMFAVDAGKELPENHELFALCRLRLDAPEDWALFRGTATPQRLLLLVGELGVDGMACPHRDLGFLRGLLLRQDPSLEGQYERVCFAAPNGRWRDWKEFVFETEIILR